MKLSDTMQVISELLRQRVVINQASLFAHNSCSSAYVCMFPYLCMSMLIPPSLNIVL